MTVEIKGVFPVWGAIEEDVEGRRLQRSWFRETDRPFRRGVGLRLRIRNVGIHLGVQRRTRAKSEIDVVGRYLDVDGETIGKWYEEDDHAEVPQEDR